MMCALFVSALAAAAPTRENYPLRDLKECSPRAGLPNFYGKLKQGKEVTIVYFGGSVISQEGYRVLSQKWFQDQFPEAKVKGIHAGVGGTGTNLGVFRMDRDVLPYHPDLVMMDWAGNDMGEPSPDNLKRTTEGVIRKIWRAYPECDIVFMHTVAEQDKPVFAQGKMKYSISVHEEVADHYGIPTIYMGMDVIKLYNAGKLVFRDSDKGLVQVAGEELNVDSPMMVNQDGKVPFSADGAHPYQNTGHRLFMDVIERSMETIEPIGEAGPHQLPEPIMPDNWENARMIPITPAMLTGDWESVEQASFHHGAFAKRLPELWRGKPGAKLVFSFTGTMVGFYDLMGQDTGYIDLRIDGKSTLVRKFDAYCAFTRLNRTISPLLPDQVHQVEVEVLAKPIDKRAILATRNQGEKLDEHPEQYEPTNWYVGAILLLGEPVAPQQQQ